MIKTYKITFMQDSSVIKQEDCTGFWKTITRIENYCRDTHGTAYFQDGQRWIGGIYQSKQFPTDKWTCSQYLSNMLQEFGEKVLTVA